MKNKWWPLRSTYRKIPVNVDSNINHLPQTSTFPIYIRLGALEEAELEEGEGGVEEKITRLAAPRTTGRVPSIGRGTLTNISDAAKDTRIPDTGIAGY